MPKPTLVQIIARTVPEITPHGVCCRWTGAVGSTGYGKVGWSVDGKATYRDTHRLVLELKVGRELSRGEWALHACDNRMCCNPEHLRVGTAKENQEESWAKGRAGLRSRPGAKNGRAVITEQMVREIRSSSLPIKEIAASVGVHWATVYKIRARKLWSHVHA